MELEKYQKKNVRLLKSLFDIVI